LEESNDKPMKICNRSLRKILTYYRIFKDYFGLPIETLNDVRRIIHLINLKSIGDLCFMTIWEHPIMIDEETFDEIVSEYSKNPITIGKIPSNEKEDTNWDVWEDTYAYERENFHKIAEDWATTKGQDIREILTYSYFGGMEDDSLSYIKERQETHFMFEYDFRSTNDFPFLKEYLTELESRILSEKRDWNLDRLI
jgi:hypothetical protein